MRESIGGGGAGKPNDMRARLGMGPDGWLRSRPVEISMQPGLRATQEPTKSGGLIGLVKGAIEKLTGKKK